MPVLNVAEIYKTIQGESSYAGLPCVMARLAGCNLNCTYCDTPHARSGGRSMTLEEIVREVQGLGPHIVEVTGGEPLLQEGTPSLLGALLSAGFDVLLETNGSLPIDDVPHEVVKIYDIKCPGSGEVEKNRWENLALLQAHDQTKFVLCDRSDYEWAKDVIGRHSLDRLQVLLSPAWGRLEARDLSSWILEDSLSVRLNVQIHKTIWPEGEPGAGRRHNDD